MTEEELEKERCIDDDYEVVSQYYTARRMYPDMPFYLQDENGELFVFGIDLIYQYIGNISQYDYPDF
tara:strand:- start:591 stop:791 length:201 start_codon:yes stop_codon:yes gene_type:complete